MEYLLIVQGGGHLSPDSSNQFFLATDKTKKDQSGRQFVSRKGSPWNYYYPDKKFYNNGLLEFT